MNTVQVIGLSLEEFTEIINGSIEQKQTEVPLNEKRGPLEKYATRKEAATALHISLPTLSDLINKGDIPAYRLGGRVLLKWEDIDNALKRIQAKKYPRAQ